MPRVKRGRVRARKRKKLLSLAKGYKWGRKKKVKLAKVAIKKAGVYAYRDRKVKKHEKRHLWTNQLNYAVRNYGMSYSRFIDALKKKKIDLDRKVLADLSANHPEVFKEIIQKIK